MPGSARFWFLVNVVGLSLGVLLMLLKRDFTPTWPLLANVLALGFFGGVLISKRGVA